MKFLQPDKTGEDGFPLRERIRKLFSNIWTISNVLTMIRLILVPVFVAVYRSGYPKWALAVFCAASLTDLLDGYLARKLNQITDFGKLFDPLADKLMVLTALFCQGTAGVFPWLPVLIVLVKELLMVLGGLFLFEKDVVVYANYFGKTATVFFLTSLILSFFHEELTAWGYRVDLWLLWISVGLALVALAVYAEHYFKQIKK